MMCEKQARVIARREIEYVNHSMKLSNRGLTPEYLQRIEDELVLELLEGKFKPSWKNDDNNI
ncbi:MAG: hypothetical protein JO129_03165 [Candidatus Dependentiae bacterium]|nr:hypothetical protein [Candidatus Dependentiae bacterium]